MVMIEERDVPAKIMTTPWGRQNLGEIKPNIENFQASVNDKLSTYFKMYKDH